MAQVEPFTYRPLNVALCEIRLVILQPRKQINGTETDDWHSHIDCNIIHSNISDDPNPGTYEALSYTWGPPEPTREILIDERPFLVRENLWDALDCLRLEDKPRPLWVDAICIDQVNDEERNCQVSQMGQIYEEAERTVVWLGGYGDSLQWIFCPTAKLKKKSQIDRTKTFEALWIQSYWRRLWIVQEFLLAKDLLLQCGEHAVTWSLFLERFRNCVKCDPDDSISSSYLHPSLTPWWPRCFDQGSSLGMLVRQREESLSSGLIRKRRKRPIVELLRIYEGARCHDARDKVFGLLGLAKSCCRSGVKVHYGASAVPLYHQILEHEVSHHDLCTETALLDLSHGLRRILQIEDLPQRVIVFQPTPPLVMIRGSLSPFWCKGKILHVMERPIADLTEFIFLEEMKSLWINYEDGVERHKLSEHIYRFSDQSQWVRKGDPKTDNLMRRLLRIFHAAESEVQKRDKYPSWAPDLSTLRIFIGENGTAGLAPGSTMKGDMICETSHRSTSRIIRVSGSYELIATAAHCDVSQPGDILKIPPPAKDPTLKVYLRRPKPVALGRKFCATAETRDMSLFEYFGDEPDFEEIMGVGQVSSLDSSGRHEGWI